MSNTLGNKLRVTIFGQMPSGIFSPANLPLIRHFMIICE